MKTKKLIALLQEADPSGELECCVDNLDIFDVFTEQAYYDGRLQVLLRDETLPYYNVVGAKYVSSGSKVRIRLLSIGAAIYENPDLPVDYSDCGNSDSEDRLKKADDETRQRARDDR